MSTPEPYAGFIDHIEGFLGKVYDAEPPVIEGENRGFALFFCKTPAEDLVSVVTNGIRFQKITTIMPIELACTVLPEQRAYARALVTLTANLVIRVGEAVQLDQVIPAPEPFWEDLDMAGVMIVNHPYIEDGFESVLNAEGRTEMQILTVVPVTAAEIAYVNEHDADALYEIWEEEETDLLDVTRASAV
ncbi:suppressor of fused domain protein [Streptomyces sp. NPDC017056]|uniref:suppressor of fused domain protein n=1 Tax=Streptomyces sp. NPDC017056 TaxID=3364973 RepID=UPI0037BB54BC